MAEKFDELRVFSIVFDCSMFSSALLEISLKFNRFCCYINQFSCTINFFELYKVVMFLCQPPLLLLGRTFSLGTQVSRCRLDPHHLEHPSAYNENISGQDWHHPLM